MLNKSSDLCLDGHQLTVKAWKGPPNDKSSLIVQNLNPNTTHETLLNYIEIVSNQDVIKIVFGEKNQAIVHLSGDAGNLTTTASFEDALCVTYTSHP